MSKKLKFYTLCLAVIYVIFFAHNVYEFGKYGIGGYKFASNEVEKIGNYQVLASRIAPVNGTATFPTTFVNEKTGDTVRVEIREIMAFMFDSSDATPFYVKIITPLINCLIFLLFLVIPFLVYRIIKSISKNEFYSIKNIKRIKKLSYVLLSIFALTLLTTYLSTVLTNIYLQLQDYTTCIDDFNYSLLFMGLVVLILSEILRYTKTIKEEQELTI